MVYGDTNSTLAGALAASKLHIPVDHVEAGLRSFNRRMPEEINRVLTDHVSTLLFCPTKTAVRNLSAQGITQGVHLVGDVMLDALLDAQALAMERSIIHDRLGLTDKKYLLASVHRAENTDDPQRLRAIITALNQLSEVEPVIFPVHPRTEKALVRHGLLPIGVLRPPASDFGASLSGLRFIAPLGYLDLVRLASSARLILTDSGGLQKEACWLRVPCVTLRDETEWVETIQSGWNVLVGVDWEGIVANIRGFQSPEKHFGPDRSGPAASAKIARVISEAS